MTKTQIEWAQQHDWYAALDPAKEGSILVTDRWTQDGECHEQERSFDDFHELKSWAGY